MVTIKGTKAFPAGSKSRSWCIQVFPRLHPIIDELEHCRLTDSGAAFVFNLTFGFNEDGRPLKTTQSTLGNIVENGSRELWHSTEASFTETIQTVVENLRFPSSGVVKNWQSLYALRTTWCRFYPNRITFLNCDFGL